MKIWNGYASEHSMNLVMIGRFKSIRHAKEAKALLDKLTRQVEKESNAYESDLAPQNRRFTDDMMNLLEASKLYTVGATELGQLVYDHNIVVKDTEVVITTNEVEVSTFLKVLVEKGGRVEVYSEHDYPNADKGRRELSGS